MSPDGTFTFLTTNEADSNIYWNELSSGNIAALPITYSVDDIRYLSGVNVFAEGTFYIFDQRSRLIKINKESVSTIASSSTISSLDAVEIIPTPGSIYGFVIRVGYNSRVSPLSLVCSRALGGPPELLYGANIATGKIEHIKFLEGSPKIILGITDHSVIVDVSTFYSVSLIQEIDFNNKLIRTIADTSLSENRKGLQYIGQVTGNDVYFQDKSGVWVFKTQN